MYHLAIRQFARSLKNLDSIIGKAVSHAEARKFDVNNFIGMRLFPDMLPFVNQVRIATDMAKATAANLGGKEAPKFEDTEKTIEELRGRLHKCISFLESFTPADFEKVTAKTVVKVPFPAGKSLLADEYLLGRQIPNFYFHFTTAYDLLRQGGVELGKLDFIGSLELLDG
jgi:uncharacterized protein